MSKSNELALQRLGEIILDVQEFMVDVERSTLETLDTQMVTHVNDNSVLHLQGKNLAIASYAVDVLLTLGEAAASFSVEE